MAYTQAQINDLLNQTMNRYNGQKPDYWGYPGECLSYGKRWLDVLKNGRLDGPMQAPSAANGFGSGYWITPPALVQELFIKQDYDPNASYPAGSLFVRTDTGHIGIMLDNQPGQSTALVSEQNADPDGSPVHLFQRLKSRINGILVIKVDAPITQPAPTQGAIEMIADTNQAVQAYKLLRPNYSPTQDEINITAGRRTWAQFASDATNELNQRDANLRAQQQALADAQNHVTNLTNQLTNLANVEATDQSQIAALKQQLTDSTTQLQTALDNVKSLQEQVGKPPEPPTVKIDWLTKLLALFAPKKA